MAYQFKDHIKAKAYAPPPKVRACGDFQASAEYQGRHIETQSLEAHIKGSFKGYYKGSIRV